MLALVCALAAGSACHVEDDVVAYGQLVEQDDRVPDLLGADAGNNSQPLPVAPNPAVQPNPPTLPDPQMPDEPMSCDIAAAIEALPFPPWILPVLIECGGPAWVILVPRSFLPAQVQEAAFLALLEDPPLPDPEPGSGSEAACEAGSPFVIDDPDFPTSGSLCPDTCHFWRQYVLWQVALECGYDDIAAEREAIVGSLLSAQADQDAGTSMP